MIHSTQNTEVILNCIAQVNILSKQMFTELEYYKNTAKPNPLYIDIKQKQLNTLTTISAMFTNVYDNIEADLIHVNTAANKHANAIFKLEAALIYFGVSLAEISQFTNQSTQAIETVIKTCVTEKWRQVPLYFKNYLDAQKMAAMWDNYTISLNPDGTTNYVTLQGTQPQTVNQPIYDLKATLNH